MKQLGGILGALMLAAITALAVAPAGASAVTIHTCEEAPVSGETAQEYTSSTCETKGAGKFRTVPIPAETPVTPKAVSSQNISGTIAGVSVEIECKGMSGSGKAENKVVGMGISGRILGFKIKLSGCSVLLPKGAGCKLKEVEAPIETETLSVFTKEEAGEILVEMVKEGGGNQIAAFTTEGCKNAVLNAVHKITGTIVGDFQNSASTCHIKSAGTLMMEGNPAAMAGFLRAVALGTENSLAFRP
jgi:hypothetical protein